MKKKVLTLSLILALAATAIVGGTMAYYTDTDAEENVFTTGKVDIDLVENFDEETAKLLPGKANAVQKEVWVELEDGSEDSYVWYTWKIPAVLDTTDGSTGTNNIVHVNSYGRTWDTYRENEAYWAENQTEALPLDRTWDHDPNVELKDLVGPEGFIGTEEIDGIEYNVYLVLYHGKLSHAEGGQTVTTPAMSQVYMDAGVDTQLVDEKTVYVDKDGVVIDFDFSEIKILVDAYAIQAEGFADVYEAYAANPIVIK